MAQHVIARSPRLDRPLAAARASGLTATSWRPRAELGVGDWVVQGRWLGAVGRASAWWLGDWIRYGNSRFGEKYDAAGRLTGYDVQSLMNMAYVAGRFAPERRRGRLSFSHHAELAGLPPAEQELWLDRAEIEELSVRALRCELRDVRRRTALREARAERRAGAASAVSAADDVVCPQCGHHFEPRPGAPPSAA
jgi:hypothetical protein